MSEKNLYLFSATFPYDKGESFLENEIPILAQRFKEIYLFPLSSKNSVKRIVPHNVFVMDALNERKSFNSRKIFIFNFFFILKVLFIEFINCTQKKFFLTNVRHFNSILLRGIYDSHFISEKLNTNSPSTLPVFYSFWMNDWALALAILKKKRKIKSFFFRCGGFDIYDERHKGNYLPFRFFIYQNASAIFPNSKKGEEYIKSKNIFPEKVSAKYWGTSDHGLNPFDKQAVFTLVSCSSIIPLKRVYLIIQILENINFEMTWVHFGDGILSQTITEMAKSLPSNITPVFKGNVSNSEIIEFYKYNPVNLFITTSETEGLPVSIQEAISFGIPIIATNVGGMPEIVTKDTGYLIEKEFNTIAVANMITEFKLSNKNSAEFRKNVRNFWEINFNSKIIYNLFCDQIENQFIKSKSPAIQKQIKFQ